MSNTSDVSAYPTTAPVSVRQGLPAGFTRLLWELRDAYEECTGESVRASKLLLDRAAFVEFLGIASQRREEKVRRAVAKIRATAPDLLPATPDGIDSAPSTDSPGPQTPVQPAGAAPLRRPSAEEIDAEHKALLERVRAAEAAAARLAAPYAAGFSPPAVASAFDRARAIAGFFAAILVSLAAARYLVSIPRSQEDRAPMLPRQESPAAPVPIPAPVGAVAVAPAAPAAAGGPVDETAALFAVPVSPSIRIHGSNTVGEKLTPNLVEAFLRSRGASVTGARAGAAIDQKEIRAHIPGRDTPFAVEVFAHGSATAFTDLQAGTASVGQSSRRIKPEEREALLPKAGDLATSAGEHVLALDGVAVIVHPSRTVSSLSLAQLARIFSGEVHDWSELGGQPGAIRVVARDEKSGTWDTFKSLVLSPSKKDLAVGATRVESSSELVRDVAADPGAIGFVGLPYVRDTVKALPLSADERGLALLPTAFTIGTEDYPLSRRLYLYTPTDGNDPWVRDFVEFALSDAGQRVVAETGFVSQTPRAEKVRSEPFQPSAYRRLTADAERLSLNFRFESGSDALDSKSVRDLDRLVHWLVSNPSRQVVLLGFTDASGDAKRNDALSLQRARRVADELRTRGIQPAQILGLGQAMPVATNASDDGRNRNRRVEVWLR